MANPKVRVYIASSIDGFIAGVNDDLSWLPGADPSAASVGTTPSADPGALGYDDFIRDVGALLMGRRTYDMVRGFGMGWPYGSRPVLVATRRSLDPDPPGTVRAVEGSIEELITSACQAAAPRDVYLDGGTLIRQAAAAGLIDELTITLAPIALGSGVPLFAGMEGRYPMEIVSHHTFPGGMLQVRARPLRS